MVHTFNIQNKGVMAVGQYFDKNPNIVKIFDDIEKFKNFCARAYLYGHSGYTFNEKDLYNNKSRAWQAFNDFRKGKKRPQQRRFNNFNRKPQRSH